MAELPTIAPGTLLNGRYVVESHLGSGGFSQVLGARDQTTDRAVALKLLHVGATADDPRAADRLRQEAAILHTLDHPNVVSLFAFEEFNDHGLLLVMELIDGTGLNELIGQGQTLTTGRLLPLIRQLLNALEATHLAGVLHRDLKPANILVTRDLDHNEQIKLLDFGVAKAAELLDEGDSDEGITLVKTRAGNFVGTPQYSSPEAVVGDPPTEASDLFCVGLIAYEALVGKPLIQGGTPSQFINQLVFPRPFDLDPVPEPWKTWLAAMLEKSPERRTSTAAEALHELDELFGEAPPPAGDVDSDASTQSLAPPQFDDDDFPTFTASPPSVSPSQDLSLVPDDHLEATIEQPPPDMSQHLHDDDPLDQVPTNDYVAPNAPERSDNTAAPQPSKSHKSLLLSLVIAMLTLVTVLGLMVVFFL